MTYLDHTASTGKIFKSNLSTACYEGEPSTCQAQDQRDEARNSRTRTGRRYQLIWQR